MQLRPHLGSQVLRWTSNHQPNPCSLQTRCWIWIEPTTWIPILFSFQVRTRDKGLCNSRSIWVFSLENTCPNSPEYPCDSCYRGTDNCSTVDLLGNQLCQKSGFNLLLTSPIRTSIPRDIIGIDGWYPGNCHPEEGTPWGMVHQG